MEAFPTATQCEHDRCSRSKTTAQGKAGVKAVMHVFDSESRRSRTQQSRRKIRNLRKLLTRSARILLLTFIIITFYSWILRRSERENALDHASYNHFGLWPGRQVSHSSSSRAKPRIAIVTFTTEQKSYTHLSLSNHQHYAKVQGYDYIVDFEQYNPIGLLWHKFTMIEEAITSGRYDWIWWQDFDTLMTNGTKPVTEAIDFALASTSQPSEVDFIFTPDCFELNAGSFLTRAHSRSIQFFDAIRVHHEANATLNNPLSEQDCIRDIIFKSDRFANRVVFVDQWRMNAFPEEIACFDKPDGYWRPGMLLIHFAGAWAWMGDVEDPTGVLMKKYQRQVVWY